MKLVAFSVQNFRSIIKTKKLPITNSTILIGPNNEGKSNILRALVTALNLLKQLGRIPFFKGKNRIPMPHIARSGLYNWEIDFPMPLQQTLPNGESIFDLEFELSTLEISDFKNKVGSMLNGTLPIRITLGKKEPDFKVIKKGRGAATLTKKGHEIAQFISSKLDFVHIPTLRTAQSARRVVEDILADELETFESNADFTRALEEIARIQQPVLDRISESIQITLKEFLPTVKGVKVTISDERRHQALRRSCEITIDDGTPTLLQHKGDGVQSLAALSLMRHASERSARGRHVILAIEEPESHLHPRAIHQLKQVISEISSRNQVILTTHCPTFVDRINIGSNIIVSTNKAAPSPNVKAIRDVLGVKAADNLQHAELVLVVEGEDDKIALSALLNHESTKIRSSISQGTLTVDSLLGGANLSYRLTQLREALCNYYCFLDYDDCGRKAFQKAEGDNLITQADMCFSVCDGMNESEIEDLYDIKVYSDMIWNGYGVMLDTPKFKSNKKWSVRMREAFRIQGKHWDEKVEKKVKAEVAEIILSNPDKALNNHKRAALDSLVKALETKLDTLAYSKM